MAETSRNKMGFLECTSYVVGNIIGSGIFITPGSILSQTGSVGLSLVVWIGCGLISLLGSVCYIELGTSILDPGCDFAYACYVGWHGIAFAFMWVSVLMTFPASAAVQAQTFGQYIVQGFSIDLGGAWQEVVTRGIGFALIFLLTFLNFYSLEKYAARFQVVATGAKMLSMAVIIITGFYFLIFEGWTSNFTDPFAGSIWSPGAISLAFYGGLWSYAGWDVLNYGTPEIYKPRRTMPLSLLSGIIIVMITYAAINVAYFAVLDSKTIENSPAVAADFALKVLGSFRFAIPFMVAILLIGTLNSNIFVGSRYMHAAAREGHLPPFVSCVHPGSGSPRAALLAQSVLTVMVSFIDTDSLINYVTFVMWAQRIVTMFALLWIRYRGIKVASGAIRVPLVLSVAFLLVSVALVVVPIVQETKVTLIGMLIVFSGLIFYVLFVRSKSLPAPLARLNDTLSRFTEATLFSNVDLKPRTEEQADAAQPARGAEREEEGERNGEKRLEGTEDELRRLRANGSPLPPL